MSKQLQQFDVDIKYAGLRLGVALRHAVLEANIVLVLVLVIIPTISGAALIA